jgi:hypothetical protein
MQHSLVVEFRRRAMLERGDLVITRGLLVLGARGMGGVRHVCGFVQVARLRLEAPLVCAMPY